VNALVRGRAGRIVGVLLVASCSSRHASETLLAGPGDAREAPGEAVSAPQRAPEANEQPEPEAADDALALLEEWNAEIEAANATVPDPDGEACAPPFPKGGLIMKPPGFAFRHVSLAVGGDLDHGEILQQLLARREEVLACHSKGVVRRLILRTSPYFRGRARIELQLDASAHVIESRVKLEDECMRACLERVTAGWRFIHGGADRTGPVTWTVDLITFPRD
jgi:hypothetical protein